MLEDLAIRVDANVLPVARRCAKESGLSLSEWISLAMWEASGEQRPGLGTRLLGVANPEGKQYTDEDIDQMRFEAIKKKHLR